MEEKLQPKDKDVLRSDRRMRKGNIASVLLLILFIR